MKVQQAGAQALSQVGQVIKNPEIQEIVGVLLEALQVTVPHILRRLSRINSLGSGTYSFHTICVTQYSRFP